MSKPTQGSLRIGNMETKLNEGESRIICGPKYPTLDNPFPPRGKKAEETAEDCRLFATLVKKDEARRGATFRAITQIANLIRKGENILLVCPYSHPDGTCHLDTVKSSILTMLD